MVAVEKIYDEDVRIRTAVQADVPALQYVFRAASLSNAGDRDALLKHPEFFLFTGEGVPEGRTTVAVGSGRVLGFATVSRAEQGQTEIEDLFVDPLWQRRGIARRLVEDLVETARDQGHQRIGVTGNSHALAFYLAVGFRQVGEVLTPLAPAPRLHRELSR